MKHKGFPVNVSPEMQMYSILKSLGYSAETAFAEFIDNSIQSFIDSKIPASDENIISVTISTNDRTIVIEDNAGGIDREHLQTALKPAGLTLQGLKHNKESLSVYGIGLKSAAIWFSETWRLETSPKGSDLKYIFDFDLPKFLSEGKEEAMVKVEDENPDISYTKITIMNNTRTPDSDTYANRVVPFILETFHKFSKIADISFKIDEKTVTPVSKKMELKKPKHLVYPPVLKNERIQKPCLIRWETNLDFMHEGRQIKGFFMIREKGSYEQPGVRLYRNKRVIQGTSVQSNTPQEILGTKNKYGAQRLYAELHLDDFDVDFMKTKFTQDLTPLYKKLNKILKEEFNVDFINQANSFRPTKATDEEKELVKKLKELNIYAEVGKSSEELDYDEIPEPETQEDEPDSSDNNEDEPSSDQNDSGEDQATGGAENDTLNTNGDATGASEGNGDGSKAGDDEPQDYDNEEDQADDDLDSSLKETGQTRIEFSNEIARLLIEYDSMKLKSIYRSLTKVSLEKHPAMAMVTAWSFFETLTRLFDREDPFNSFFANKINTSWFTEINREAKKDLKLPLDKIHAEGNSTKHSAQNFSMDAKPLRLHFRILEPVIIKALEELVDIKNNPTS